MHEYSHHLPGRLRLRFPQLKNRPTYAAQLTASIARIDGVVSVDANVITGGLLIFYDLERADSSGLWHALSATLVAHDLSGQVNQQLPQPRAPGASKMVDKVADKVVGSLVEKLVERSAVALIASLL
jgi:hypothetical protein